MDSLVVPKFQILDQNGDPLNGGKVWTYDSGTTTPKITYTDRGLTVANTNPVILDSRGECAIFCSGLLKLYVTDSSDVAIYPAPLDNLRPSEPGALFDTDGDTGIEVEAAPDEDKVRIQTAGVERLVIDYLGIRPTVGNGICDTDGDMQIYLEKTADDDTIRFDCSGSELITITSAGLAFSTGSRVLGISNDATLAADAESLACTQQAIKAYVDAVIPTGQKIWFYTNTAVPGWALDTGVVDAVLYASGAGTPGGAVRAGGSWTISGMTHAHTHIGPSHAHATVAHKHGTSVGSSGSGTLRIKDVPLGGTLTATTAHHWFSGGTSDNVSRDYNYTDSTANTATTYSGSSATGGASAGPESDGTWRPTGYVNTLQVKL